MSDLLSLQHKSLAEVISEVASTSSRQKIMAIGNYNGVNLGDNAILKTILHDLEALPLEIVVPTRFPEMTKQIYREGLTNPVRLVLNKSPYLELLRQSLQAKLIFVGGGTIFSKYAGSFVYVLPYYLILMRLLGKKVIYYSQGFDPSTAWYLRVAAYLSMILASRVSVRDTKSYRTLKWVRKFRNVDLIADPVKHMLEIKNPEISRLVEEDRQQLAQKYPLAKKYVLTCFNYVKEPEKNKLLEEKLTYLVDTFAARGQEVLLASFQNSKLFLRDDYRLNLAIKKRSKNSEKLHVISEMLDPFTTIELMKNADFLVAERLHSMVLANLSKTDFFGISYQRKCTAFLEQIEYSNFVELEEFLQMSEQQINNLV